MRAATRASSGMWPPPERLRATNANKPVATKTRVAQMTAAVRRPVIEHTPPSIALAQTMRANGEGLEGLPEPTAIEARPARIKSTPAKTGATDPTCWAELGGCCGVCRWRVYKVTFAGERIARSASSRGSLDPQWQ